VRGCPGISLTAAQRSAPAVKNPLLLVLLCVLPAAVGPEEEEEEIIRLPWRGQYIEPERQLA
jgi:hypothetical protein